jgi:hypothetical protein
VAFTGLAGIFRLPLRRFGVMMPLNHTIPMKRIFPVILFALGFVPWFPAWAGEEAEAVTVKDDKVYAVTGERRKALTAELKFPDKVMVNTNGSFTVGNGKERKLEEGQMLRRDGWLVSPDGSVQPVVDHLAMKEGRAYLVRDGKAAPLTATLSFPNGRQVNPDGYGSGLPAGRARLADGQLFRLDGTVIPGKDTATFKNGRVVVLRDGSLIPLTAVQVMGMNDGTRVFGSGSVQKHDGTMIQLSEGQTVLIDAANYGN